MKDRTSTSNQLENLVIISLDCVRREALGCYPQKFPLKSRVFQGANTPNIDKLCAAGTRFDQAVTHAPFTPAAHASLLTGLIPPKHRVRSLFGAKLDRDVVTLAERLSSEGWKCGAVVGAHSMSNEYGFARGFHYFDDDIQKGFKNWHLGERRDAQAVTDRAIRWLQSLESEDHFFLFAHYFDAHNISGQPAVKVARDPNRSSYKRTRRKLRESLPEVFLKVLQPIDRTVRGLYYAILKVTLDVLDDGLGFFEAGRSYTDEGRRFMLKQTSAVDSQLGRLVQFLSEQGRLDNTLIVILADHGDDFWEHGEPTHRHYLYDSTLIVPMIIYPVIETRPVVEEQVRIVDIFPTVLALLGVEIREDIDGRSLFDGYSAHPTPQAETSPRRAYSETVYGEFDRVTCEEEISKCYASLRAYPWKLIWDRLADTYELYRVDEDHHERNNLVNDNRELVAEMSAELRGLAQAMPAGATSADSVIVERLQALGYL